jgi:hypothetical protein
MRLVLSLLAFGMAGSFVHVASAQNGQEDAQCAALQAKAGDGLGFIVYRGAPEPISKSDWEPTELRSKGAVNFHVCLPLDPQRNAPQGAINVKVQIYTSEDAKSEEAGNRVAEYENNTDRYRVALTKFRARNGASAYPSLDIADYQNYHGCTQRRSSPLDTEFHVDVDGRRTNDDPFRSKFVFTRDVKPACEIPGKLAEFLGGLPSVGTPIAFAAGRYDPRIEKIVRRRSIILRYDLRASPRRIQYVRYDLNGISKNKCLRVEASDVLDPRSNGSVVIGVGCVFEPE